MSDWGKKIEGFKVDECNLCGVKEGLRHSEDCPKLAKGGIINTSGFEKAVKGEIIIPLNASLVFIQEKDKRFPTIYQDGKELKGVRSITINAHAEDITTHTVEFITQFTGGREG